MSLCRYIWESSANGNFAVSEDTENEPLGRGTDIRIYLKKDAAEYATEEKLQVSIFITTFETPRTIEIVIYMIINNSRYSLINIYLYASLSRLKCFLQELVKRYSQFVNFPIYLWASKEVEDQVDVEEENATIDDTTFEEGSSKETSEDEKKETDGTEDEPSTKNGKY